MVKRLASLLMLGLPLLAAAADYATPAQGLYPVPDAPYTATFRSVSLADLVARGTTTGIWNGAPKVQQNRAWYDEHFYDTLAAKKAWHPGHGPYNHRFQDPIAWDIVPIPQRPPPPCDQMQPTGYDAEGCRYVSALFKDLERTDPAAARLAREQARRGRDVWFKGTFGDQDEEYLHTARTVGEIWYPWLDTRTRSQRFTKWGMINDPDCTQGDASTNWYDKCPDPHSSGVLGYRKYLADPQVDAQGKVVFDPATSAYRPDELKKNLRYVLGGPCVQCHVAFDPTHPPKDPNQPQWENIHATIGNQYTNQPLQYLMGTPEDAIARELIGAARPGTVDTSLQASDFQHNPGTQNNIMDFMNKRVFEEDMKDPVTGAVKKAKTRHVLKGGEDSVGEHLALIRVYVNIGMCTEECWTPHFPRPGSFFGGKSHQTPFDIAQCSKDCEAWNYADAKMPDLAAFLLTGGPTYLLKARDVDGTPGASFVDLAKVPAGRQVFARECAGCHSSKFAPDNVRADKEQLAAFYEGHVFGSEDYWQYEFTEAERNAPAFKAKYLATDAQGRLRPKQFAADGMFGQDWLANDEAVPFNVVGTNSCRALHDNHNRGHVWEQFSSETYKSRASPGAVPTVFNRMLPGLSGRQWGEHAIEGGPGYLRNFSLLSAWATAPFLHNNSVGELTYLADGSIDYTVRGRIRQFELAFAELMLSDDPQVEPHRPQKITTTSREVAVAPREDQQGPIRLPVKKGTPVAYFASSDPHRPLFMKCDDPGENHGHPFGVSLSADDQLALREFLKLM
jgi:mono/diheme cytochrome c family protein